MTRSHRSVTDPQLKAEVLKHLDGALTALSTSALTSAVGFPVSGTDRPNGYQSRVNQLLHELMEEGKVVRHPLYRSYSWSLS